jgi:YVTN family beta-propeller protein
VARSSARGLAYEPFAQPEIARLEESRLAALEERIDADLAAGEHARLVGELEGLVREHPLRERLRAQLMLALYRSGRQADALQAYRDARRGLVDEIGVEPGPELRRLHEAILHHNAATLDLSAAAPTTAGSPPSSSADGRTSPSAARKRSGVLALAAAAALALLGGVAIYAVSRWSGPHGLARVDQNYVGLIDPHTATITAEYPVGRAPSALAAGGGSVWAINALDSTVSRIDRERDQIVRIPVGGGPAGLAFAAGSVWVTESQDGTVAQISPAADRVVERIAVGNAPGAIAAGFGALWIASQVDPTVVRVDLTTGARTTIGLASVPTAIAAGAGAVWVASEESGTVYRIDPSSREAVDAIGVGNGPIDLAAGEGAVWVANHQDGTVSRIDPGTDAMTDVTPVGRDPTAIAAGLGGVWVADSSDATVRWIDPQMRRVDNIIRVTSSPSALAVAAGSVWTAVNAPPADHRGGTLRVETQFLLGGDPQDDPSGPTSLVYDGLVAYRRAGGSTFGTLVGDLATEVPKPSADGTTYVFRLRPNIRYSNGEPVRPRDFRAALEAVFRRHPSIPLSDAYLNIQGVPVCVQTPSRCDLSSGIVTDERARTITLHLTKPDADLPYYLTYPFGYLVPADHPFGPGTLPPGTGPYKIAFFDYKRGAELVRNPYFRVWSNDARPDGFADRIEVRLGDNINKQIAAVQRGQADVVVVDGPFGGPLAPAGLRALATSDAGQLYTDPSPELDYMFLNVRTPPFNDVRVRRAVNYAVDRRQVSQLAGGPALAQPTCQYVPPGFPGYTASCRYTLGPGPAGAWIAPDIEKARRLIQQSGTAGTSITVWGYQDKRPIIRYFAALLHQLGYHTSVRLFPDYGS